MRSKKTSLKPNNISRRLHHAWWLAALVCGFILAGGFTVVTYRFPNQNNLQWILQTVFITVYVLGLLRYGLPLNYAARQNVLYSNLGYATWITIVRAMLICMLAGFLFQPWPHSNASSTSLSWAPGILYITASVLDYVDGLVARGCKHQTHLGAFLDINIDALGLLIAPLLAVWYGQLPIAYLAVGAAYYVFIVGIWLRKKMSKPVVDPKPRPSARIIAGFQMGFVGMALLPIFSPPATTIAAYIFMVPLLAGFVKDWCYACGYPKKNSGAITPEKHHLNSFPTR